MEYKNNLKQEKADFHVKTTKIKRARIQELLKLSTSRQDVTIIQALEEYFNIKKD